MNNNNFLLNGNDSKVSINNGRKISTNIENPIDNHIISLCDKMIKFCVKYEITPNEITLTRLFLLYFIYNYLFKTNKKFIPIVLIMIFYFMDCLDGHLARTTDSVTKVGDILDHLTDFIFLVMIFYYVYSLNNKKILVIYIIFLYLGLAHMGVQQLNYAHNNPNKQFEFIDYFNNFHLFKKDDITLTRYFGCGTFVLIVVLIIYFYKKNNQ